MKQVDIGLAARAMIRLCKASEDCGTCKISFLCNNAAPLEWNETQLPKEGELVALFLEAGENSDKT